MRILVATNFRAVAGGTETYLRALVPALLRRGHEVGLLYLNEAASGPRIDDGLDLPLWRGAESIPQDVFRWRPDVCYLQTTDSPDVDETLARRLPTVAYAHSFYGTCATGFKCRGRSGPAPCNVRFGSSCLVRNYVQGCGVRNPKRLWETYRKQVRRQRLLSKFRAVLTASNYMAREMIAHGAPPERTAVVPLFPTDTVPDPQPPAARRPGSRILFIGRYTEVKGGLLLIEAARQVADAQPVELTFAGAGPDEADWRAAALRSGVRATFHPWMQPEHLAALRREASLLAVPSIWPEPFGLVGIEAACQGLPAVGFDVGGIGDWLIPGETGELAPSPPRASGLAEAILRALRDPFHLDRLRLGAWSRSRQFSLERHLRELEQVLAEAHGASPTHAPDDDCLQPEGPRRRRVSSLAGGSS